MNSIVYKHINESSYNEEMVMFKPAFHENKYFCPICSSIGIDRTIYEGQKVCPTCNVWFSWDDF